MPRRETLRILSHDGAGKESARSKDELARSEEGSIDVRFGYVCSVVLLFCPL